MSLDFDDWSTHLMQASVQLKALEHGLLHKNYSDLQKHATAAKKSIDRTMAWLARQGSNSGVDVLAILEDNMPALNDDNPIKSLLVASIQEISQLRSERQFWLKSGFEIGSKELGELEFAAKRMLYAIEDGESFDRLDAMYAPALRGALSRLHAKQK